MWSLVTHQLENARALAKIDSGRPRFASLRRAVSTAYYALFQALCETCVAELVGWDQPWAVITPIFRALDHGRAKQVLNESSIAATPELERMGRAFSDLLEAREWADYDPEPRPNFRGRAKTALFTRSEALRFIEIADDAIMTLDRLDDQTRLKLATRLVTKSRK